jgi:hypothetical protein
VDAPEKFLNGFLTSGFGKKLAPCSFFKNKQWFQVAGPPGFQETLEHWLCRAPDAGTVH